MHPRLRALGLRGGRAGVGLPAITIALAGCITAPPPDLPAIPVHRPTILHQSAVPPEDVLLTIWPDTFIVPVELNDPSQSYQWDVFVDYDPVGNNGAPTGPFRFPESGPAPVAGIAIVSFPLPPPATTAPCPHRIEFLVAHSFNPNYPHISDSLGSDRVVWSYAPGGGASGCPQYDAGALLQDGAFPADSSLDGPPVVNSGGD